MSEAKTALSLRIDSDLVEWLDELVEERWAKNKTEAVQKLLERAKSGVDREGQDEGGAWDIIKLETMLIKVHEEPGIVRSLAPPLLLALIEEKQVELRNKGREGYLIDSVIVEVGVRLCYLNYLFADWRKLIDSEDVIADYTGTTLSQIAKMVDKVPMAAWQNDRLRDLLTRQKDFLLPFIRERRRGDVDR